MHTETIIQSTNSLIRVNVSVNRHKHKGYCTSLCSFSGVSFISKQYNRNFENQIKTILSYNVEIFIEKTSLNQLKCRVMDFKLQLFFLSLSGSIAFWSEIPS